MKETIHIIINLFKGSKLVLLTEEKGKWEKIMYNSIGFLKIIRVILLCWFCVSGSNPILAKNINSTGIHDRQETIIKHVLEETGTTFAVGPGTHCTYASYHGTTFCVEIVGPERANKAVRYGLNYPLTDKRGYCSGKTLVWIYAWNSPAAAKDYILKQIKLWGSASRRTFHDKTALGLGSGKNIDSWQAGRFVFTVNNPKPELNLGFSKMEFAEELYRISAASGLISDKGNVIHDADRDGIPDNRDKCPNTPYGTAVEIDGCAKKDMLVSVSPNHFSKTGDMARIKIRLVGGNTQNISAKTVILENGNNRLKKITDSSGTVDFIVKHTDEKQQSYTYVIHTDKMSRKVTIPVNRIEAFLEKNPLTGEPYKGILADGKTWIKIIINTSRLPRGVLKVKQPSLGTVKCIGSDSQCTTIPLNHKKQIALKYCPPVYLQKSSLNEKVILTGKARKIITDAISSGSFYLNSGRPPMAASVPVEFAYQYPDGHQVLFTVNIQLTRPPVMLVHGFTGGMSTWGKLQTYLGGERFDPVIDEYYSGNQGINAQSKSLSANIKRELKRYRALGFKGKCVDVIGHSMGGLIARNYIQGYPQFRGDIRKLIMVGTPNHGVSFTDYAAGVFVSDFLGKHRIAATQLYADSAFMKALNRGETAGRHLRPGVQYGNIFGITDDYVVPMASAFLNGVKYKTLEHTAHSPAVPLPGVAITESKKVWDWLRTWLTHDIPRTALKNMRVEIASGSGKVFKRTLALRNGEIRELENTVKTYPTRVLPWEDIGCKSTSNALLHLNIGNHQWGSIQLSENSLIELGFLSPQSVTVRVRKGSARFVSLERQGGGHFTVSVGPENSGNWFTFHPNAKVIGLDTDFIVTVHPDMSVTVKTLKGRARIESSADNSDSFKIINRGQTGEISQKGEIRLKAPLLPHGGQQPISANKTSLFPVNTWERHSLSGGQCTIQGNQLCIDAMQPGGAWFTTYRPYKLVGDYTVRFDIKLNTSDNHFPILYSDGFIYMMIDWGTMLAHYQPGRPYNLKDVMNLEQGRWYKIRIEAHPSQKSFDLYLDNKLISKASGIIPMHDAHTAPPQITDGSVIWMGDADSTAYRGGNYNRGSICWRGIAVRKAAYPVNSVKNRLEKSEDYVWILNSNHQIFRWNGTGWKYIPRKATDIGVGSNGTVWITGDDVLPHGHSISRWMDDVQAFVRLSGEAVRIDVNHFGIPWVVNNRGDIFRWKDRHWEHVPGKATDIGIGPEGSVFVLGVNRVQGGYGIYHWNGSGWDQYPGGGIRIDVDSSGNPWLVNIDGNILRWKDTGWELLPGKASDISIGGKTAWIIGVENITGGHGIYRWNDQLRTWKKVPGAAAAISVGSPPVSNGFVPHLTSGSYRVDHQIGGTTWHSTWKLKVINSRITGTSQWACCPHKRVDPMTGIISADSVTITRDCSGQGYKGPCSQTYRGKLKNGRIEGEATGTGLGLKNHWVLYLNQ
ncbi:PGAP1-like alpha/beta domain-containing protein [Desulfomarina sp.]